MVARIGRTGDTTRAMMDGSRHPRGLKAPTTDVVPGRATRGRTRVHRLRAVDDYLARCERTLLSRVDGEFAQALFVDVGFGDHPGTTLDSARAFRAVHPPLRVLGVELEPQRVAHAQRHADPSTFFRPGGFNLPLQPGETVRLIRVMNVVRGYRPDEVAHIHQVLGESLLPGGLLVEGSTDTPGGVTVAHLMRRTAAGLCREAMLFHTDFTRGFAPRLFRDWLPRDLRRRVKPGEPIHTFFETWMQAWEQARVTPRMDPRQCFPPSIRNLATRTPGIDLDPWLLDHGYMLWRPPGGVCM